MIPGDSPCPATTPLPHAQRVEKIPAVHAWGRTLYVDTTSISLGAHPRLKSLSGNGTRSIALQPPPGLRARRFVTQRLDLSDYQSDSCPRS